MNETSDSIILDTAERIFSDLCGPQTVNEAEAGKWPQALWDALQESGLPLASVGEEWGGAGASRADGFAVLRLAGRFAAPVPLAETLLAGLLLEKARIPVPPGPLTIAPVVAKGAVAVSPAGLLSGRARRVPFARNAAFIALLAGRGEERFVALLPREGIGLSPGTSLAGEPADDLSFDGLAAARLAPSAIEEEALLALGAALRVQQIAGALEGILEQSISYAGDRTQFGRPIAKFQVIQHNLAMLAGEAAAASAAAQAALEACGKERIDVAALAAAKIRAGEAAGTGAAIAHQVHGAMGFTYEHSLHHRTRRLWAWREEFGNESFWAIRLGQLVAARGAEALWPTLAADL